MRVLICGGRDYKNEQKLEAKLDELHKIHKFTVVITGMNPNGADKYARAWAVKHGIEPVDFPADWKALGKAAGPKRNQQMLDEGKPELVVAFPTENSIGTYDMIRRAFKAGVQVHQV